MPRDDEPVSDDPHRRNPPEANVDVHIGAQIRSRRRLLGLTQEDLASRIGLTAQQIHKYENGANRVAASKLFEIATVLSLPIKVFFDGLPSPAPDDPEPEARGNDRVRLDKDALDLAISFSDIEEERLKRVVLSIVKAAAEADKDQD